MCLDLLPLSHHCNEAEMRWRCLGLALSQTLTLTRPRPLPRRRLFSSSPAAVGDGVAIKNVTRSNFQQTLEDLRIRIRESDFVAVDLEMTGVTSAPWRDAFEFDRSDVRYLKLKDSAEKFAVVQVGVCTFRWDPAKGSFVAHPHNFYIFPRKELPIDGPSYEFLCQTSSINFLAKYQFDFNACIHEGISYLSRAQEAEALEKLSSAYENELSNSSYNSEECVKIPIVSTADLLFTERMKIKFQEWRDGILRSPDDVSSSEGSLGGPQMQLQTVFCNMRPAVVLNGFSSHQLKLIKLVLKKHFKDLVYVRGVDDDIALEKKVVYTDSEEDRVSFMREIREDQLRRTGERVKSAVGFRHVIDLLASESKVIVGHNCFLDMAHIHSKFFGPLPQEMSDFVGSLHTNFPHIIDTKHLLNASPALQILMKKSSKSLSSAFSVLCPKISSTFDSSATNSRVKVEVQADEAGSSCWSSGAKHEAGYDAFMTGCIFAQACSHIGIKFELNSAMTDFTRNDKLQNYMNIVYPTWSSGTVINLSTGTESPDSGYKRKYPTVVFENIIVVCGFPSKVKPKDMKASICKVFGPDSVTSIFFLDATAALIQFSKEEYVDDFLLLKDTLEQDDGPISVLHPLADMLEGGRSRAGRYDAYREICGSAASRVLFADQAETVDIKWRAGVECGQLAETQFAGREATTEDTSLPSVTNQVSRRVSSPGRRSRHQVSCEDILESLSASKSVFGKRKRST